MLLIPNQHFNAVALREAWERCAAMHPDALDKIVGHADVKGSVPAAGKNVNRMPCWLVSSGSPLARGRTERELPLDLHADVAVERGGVLHQVGRAGAVHDRAALEQDRVLGE